MKIIWTDFATENLKNIFDYYSVNANKKIAHEIRKQILEATKQLKKNPEAGQKELYLESLGPVFRYLVASNYKIIYRFDDNQIFINDVFDTRQDPIKIMDKSRRLK
jgi:toxin ParE1/3/4